MIAKKVLLIVGTVAFAAYTFFSFLDTLGLTSLLAALVMLISAVRLVFVRDREDSELAAVWYILSSGFAFVNSFSDGRCFAAGAYCALVALMLFLRPMERE